MLEADLGPVWGATATPANTGVPLGVVLGEVLQRQRDLGAGGDAGAGMGMSMVDELPSLEELVAAQAVAAAAAAGEEVNEAQQQHHHQQQQPAKASPSVPRVASSSSGRHSVRPLPEALNIIDTIAADAAEGGSSSDGMSSSLWEGKQQLTDAADHQETERSGSGTKKPWEQPSTAQRPMPRFKRKP